jgi:HPt (histidine-containing phosphotransfer) domain-containing protein
VSLDQPPLLDRTRLAELSELFSGDELAELLNNLSDEVRAELEHAANAAAAGDRPELAAAAHKIRNSGLMVGGARLVALATETERHTRGEADVAQGDATQLVSQLKDCWTQTSAAIAATTSA